MRLQTRTVQTNKQTRKHCTRRMATRYSRRLPARGTARSTRTYRFPRKYGTTRRTGRTYRGRGSYWGLAASLAARAAPYAFRAYGAYRRGGTSGLKKYAGSLLSSAARSAIKRYTGYGAYSKVGYGGMTGNQAPHIINGAKDGSIVISNKEYLGDVVSNNASNVLTSATYTINPGNSDTFPWLSAIARNYQEYRLEGLAFTYRSMWAEVTSNVGQDGSQGSVILSTEYDPTVDTATTKQELANSEFSQTVKPSQSCTHFIECAKGETPLSNLYVAAEDEAQKGDPRFYNFGKFSISTVGIAANYTTLGELWVSYQIRLYKPKLILEGAKDKLFIWARKGTDVASTNNPMGELSMTDPIYQEAYCYPGTNFFPTSMSGLKISFPGSRLPKNYIITFYWKGTAALCQVDPPTLKNCDYDNHVLRTGGQVEADADIEAPQNAASCTEKIEIFAIKQRGTQLNGQPWTMEFANNSVLPANPTHFKMIVTEIPYRDDTAVN